jgi:hypothetical protein
MKKIIAIYLGKDDSLGYKINHTYVLKLYKSNWFNRVFRGWEFTITREDGSGLCHYQDKKSFNKRWEKITQNDER